MNSKERVLAALRGQATDRVPVMEMGIDWAVVKGLGYSSYLDMIGDMELDGGFGEPDAVRPRLETLGDSPSEALCRRMGRPQPADRRTAADPGGAPDPDTGASGGVSAATSENSALLKAVRHVRRCFPDKAVAVLSRNDFAASWFLCGMDVLLMSYVDNPDFADRLCEMVNAYCCELYRLCIREGADVIYLTDDYAYKTGTLMSRVHFQRYILPWLQRGVDAVHEAGGLCIKHSDGNLSGILDLIVDTGVDGLGPLEPAAGNDLIALRESLGPKPALVGNIDVDLLSRGSAAEVYSASESLVNGPHFRRGTHPLFGKYYLRFRGSGELQGYGGNGPEGIRRTGVSCSQDARGFQKSEFPYFNEG